MTIYPTILKFPQFMATLNIYCETFYTAHIEGGGPNIFTENIILDNVMQIHKLLPFMKSFCWIMLKNSYLYQDGDM